jgi:hypothetical protein
VRDQDADFAELKALHPSASLHTENSVPVVLLPGFKFRAGGNAQEMALLLHPSQHSGYVTRLFFERRLDGAGASANWNPHTVLSRTWWAPSWQNVTPDQSWTSMLGAHLKAVA